MSIIKSKKYVEGIRHVITKDLINASSFGTIPFKYINLNNYPRIGLQFYGNSINSTKKVVRTKVYEILGSYAYFKHGQVFIEVDLVSCYTFIF